ncbi:chemotaxis protein CheB [Desulfogranum mediterraneum]|uniref:chemotaxis protein CheB n=1 Tax=Desulfogranum mediterraneum TaxID=160661 RepID=UPI00041AA0D6|nr:chemotaxis protein CheB [Desulfogranum mediterraneum]
MQNHYEAVVIGVSAGGFRALHTLLSELPDHFTLPVMIVQHRKASAENYLVTSLNKNCRLLVKEADEKEKITSGTVYLAPGDYHLLVEKDKTLSLSIDEPVCYSRPSIDVLFETAAATYQAGLIGIILTGANSDGSAGIRSIKAGGGLTISQHPETAEADTMPLAAIATKAVDYILTLQEISPFLNDLLEQSHETKE